MPLTDRIYAWLQRGLGPESDRILAAGLPHAEESWLERIIAALVERDRPESWRALIGHYERTRAAIDPLLNLGRDSVRAGLSGALQSQSPRERENALKILKSRPTANLAYAVANTLHDAVPAIRGAAAEVLLRIADEVLRLIEVRSAEGGPTEAARQTEVSIVRALREAVNGYDNHLRGEALQAAAWYSRHMGAEFWEKITSPRSRAGALIRRQLERWDHPRLAHFLVKSLKYVELRAAAARVLQSWSTVPQVSALLAEHALLDDSDISRGLAAVQRPAWFADSDPGLGCFPAELRVNAPRWAASAGYDEATRIKLLSHWMRSGDRELHSATIYALARLDTSGARKLLEEAARGNSPLAAFAKWCVQAFDIERGRKMRHSAPSSGAAGVEQAERDNSELGERDADCIMLWLACRRAPRRCRDELIGALRDNAPAWDPWLRRYLKSPDPRDRVLALQVINTRELAPLFADEIARLAQDSIDGIRRLAGMMRENLQRRPASPAPTAKTRPPRAPHPAPAHDAVRRELRRTLELISGGELAFEDADLAARVRRLLTEVYPVDNRADQICASAG